MSLRWLLFALFSFLIISTKVLGHERALELSGIEEQLSQSEVTAIVQDKQGFLWIGTEDGLNRYDGYQVRIFNSQNSNLVHNFITDLLIDDFGNLWVATIKGLSVYQSSTGKFKNYYSNLNEPFSLPDNTVMDLARGSNGAVWVATFAGPALFDPESGSFRKYPIMLNRRVDSSIQEVSQIFVDSEARVWLTTTRGDLAKLDSVGARFTIIQNASSDRWGSAWDIQQSTDGKIYLATKEKGFIIFNPASERFSRISGKQLGLQQDDYQASSILFDNNNAIWLGTRRFGIYKKESQEQEYKHYLYNTGSVASNNINAIFQDREGITWIGTSSYINKINSNNISFLHLEHDELNPNSLVSSSVFSITVNSNNELWVGTEDQGLSLYKISNELSKIKDIIPPQLNGESIVKVLELSSQRMALVSYSRLWIYDNLTGETKLHYQIQNPNDQITDAVYYQQSIWLGLEGKIIELNENGNSNSFPIHQMYSSESQYINVLLYDKSREGAWVGTEDGLFFFDLQSKKFNPLSHFIKASKKSQQYIISLSFDSIGRLWVGTYGNGIFIFDFTKQTVEEVNSMVSGIHNTIYSLMADNQNSMWVGTGKGLYKVNTSDLSLALFSVSEQQPILEFNSSAVEKDPNGSLYFGGINGLINFEPKLYAKELTPPQPVITDIYINNNRASVHQEEQSILKTSTALTDSIELSPEQNNISIQFSAMNFITPKSNGYKYKLEGYDQDWLSSDAKVRRATYNGLEPGNYSFQVLASNKDGVWSVTPTSLAIKVNSSRWLSPLAYTSYGFILGLIILAFSYLYWLRQRERRIAELQLSESEERLKLSLWGSGDELWDWRITSGALHLSNEWEYEFPRDGIRSGYSESNSNIHPNDLPFVKQAINAHLDGKSSHYESTYRLYIGDEQWIWVMDRGKVVVRDQLERPLRMAGTLKNITELKNTEQQLSMVVKSFDNISDAVWILDKDFNYIAINKAFKKITGYDDSEVLGRAMKIDAVKQVDEDFFDDLKSKLSHVGRWQGELDAVRKSGQVYPIDLNIDVVRDNDGHVINYVGVFSDITFRKKAEKELLRLATVDHLTGLKNRNSFRHEFEQIIQSSSEQDQHALLFIDLDNFKRINDSLGHGAGDELLSKISVQLREIADQENALLGRLGGDEFVIFLEDIDNWNLSANIAQDILDRFSKPMSLSSGDVLVSPSIGVVLYPDNGHSAEELLKNADTAMYYAKKKGKNTYQFYTKQMNEQAKLKITLENDLRRAIEKDEFVVYYQPKVSLETGKISGMEALVRWHHPERGLVMPNEFIPFAEEVGFIIPISQKVIEKTCWQIRDWQDRNLYQGKIAVNLSAVQFYHENLWETVKGALRLAKVEASSLEFEITERMVMEDLGHSIRQMNTLQEMGISLALDDFGVGYSSLGNLKDFPIDTLKIDRSFIWDLDESERDRSLVSSIVTLAHNLDIGVVAEGVETIEQIEALKSMKCEEIQGFIFSKPLTYYQMEAMLQDPEANLEVILQKNQNFDE